MEIIARSYTVAVDKILVFSMVILYWCLLEDGCALKDSSWLNFPGLVVYDPVSYKNVVILNSLKNKPISTVRNNEFCEKI